MYGLVLYLPGGQYAQASADVPPPTALYRPTAHGVHAAVPPAPHVPGGHWLHVPAGAVPAVNPYPGLHDVHAPLFITHSAHPTPPSDVLALHGMHTPAPAKLYSVVGADRPDAPRSHWWHV